MSVTVTVSPFVASLLPSFNVACRCWGEHHVPQFLCFPVTLFLSTYVLQNYVPQYWTPCSSVPMFSEPMYSGTYVPRNLRSPEPMFPEPMQGSKFHLSVSPGQVHFPPDNKITKVCCPSDNQVAAAGSSLSDFSVRF